MKGERLGLWDVRDGSFDQQWRDLVIEDAAFDERGLVCVPDRFSFGVSEMLRVPGAIHGEPSVEACGFRYPTNFGDPTLVPASQSVYARFTFSLPVDRD